MSRFATATQTRTEVLSAFMRGVYGWMCTGLALTAGVAYYTVSSPSMLQTIFGTPGLFFGLLIGELILVFVLIGAIRKLSATMASGLFLAYSALNGVTLSSALLYYGQASVVSAFVTCSAMFAAMSVYGMVTKRDLTGMGQFMIMGLFGLIIAMIVNIFLASAAMDFVISAIGVIIFTGLTAYDTQKLKAMGESAPSDDATAVRRGTILGALTLYLDFINLFLFLLRFMGGGRD